MYPLLEKEHELTSHSDSCKLEIKLARGIKHGPGIENV
jgi:hypothetical protein